MGSNASCNHIHSSRLHSVMGASPPALGFPYFHRESVVSDMSVCMHLPLHCRWPFVHLMFGGLSRLFGMPMLFSYVLFFRPWLLPLPSRFVFNTAI